MSMKRITFLGLPLDVGASVEGVCQLLQKKGKPRLVTFINPAAWALAEKRPEYVPTLEQMSLNLPDGEGVALACRLLTKEDCQRVSFDMTSLADPFLRAVIERKASLMLVGGDPGVDESMHEKLHVHYPELKIVGTFHGYGDFGPKVEGVIAKSPDAVIVAMGAPRQEAFLLALRDAGYKGMAITCGGFFDQYLLADPYYPRWVDEWNIRFLYRLYKEPGRLWRRYLIEYQVFIKKLVCAIVEKVKGVYLKRVSKAS
ncbi:MAG: WecB/TagA/CpsF family glycosyltransferase [Alphaproteobacteria bacterium]|nr:WecB/TagA/CpsF family glycosyltransferase [Alphaproteobacteria bacterium]